MDITHAYIQEYGEQPADEPSPWQHDLETFTAGWNACGVSVEDETCSTCNHRNEGDGIHGMYCELHNVPCEYEAKCKNWLGVQEELLEIEADVLYQNEGLTRGE